MLPRQGDFDKRKFQFLTSRRPHPLLTCLGAVLRCRSATMTEEPMGSEWQTTIHDVQDSIATQITA